MKAYFSLNILKTELWFWSPMEMWTNFQENVLMEFSWLLSNTIKNIKFIISIYKKMSCLDPFVSNPVILH